MDAKSKEILDLAEAIRLSIKDDWTAQRERGERTLGYSEDDTQKQIKAHYPDIKTGQVFKTIYGYAKQNAEAIAEGKNPVRLFPLWKLEIILRYLFVDISTPYGWPNVVKTVRNFKDGKYLSLVNPYIAEGGIGRIEKILNEELLVKAGASPGQSAATQLLQLALKLNTEYSAMEDRNKQLSNDKQALAEKLKERSEKIATLKQDLARMEGVLASKSGNKEPIALKIKEIRKMLDSLD